MMSRGWAAALLVTLFTSAAFLATGCRRERTQLPGEIARTSTANTNAAADLLERDFPESPAKPASLKLATDLRILAPPGYFDRYDPVDLKRDRIPDDVQLYVTNRRTGYSPVSRATAAKAPPDRQLYAYRRAPAIERFEKDYGISVAVAHFTEEELRFTGVHAEHAKEFDLVFGPRGMLPVILDQDNLAPFDTDALTRFVQPRIYITEALGHLPDDTDLDFCIPYYRSPIGLGFDSEVVAGIPRSWADGFESDSTDFYWHRVLLRRDPFVLLSAAILYQHDLPPKELARSQQSTRELLQRVAALASPSGQNRNRSVALESLRHEFATTSSVAAPRAHNEFEMHTATFTSEQNDAFAAEHYREFEVESADDPQFDSDAAVESAADLLKRLLVYGAEFFDERTDSARLKTSDWAYLIGSSGRSFASLSDDPRFGFSLPAPKSPVELDVFAMPAGRDEINRETAQFFVDFLLTPEVAASMTVFAHHATLVRDSLAFLPSEVVNSAIFSLPARQDIIYLPIVAGNEERLRRIWNDIVDFRDSIKAIDDSSDVQKTASARRK